MQHACLHPQDEGCYFALLRRRKITQPDVPLAVRSYESEGSVASAPAASGRQQDWKAKQSFLKKKLRPLKKSQMEQVL